MELKPEEPPLVDIIARPPRILDKRLNPTAIFSKTGKGVQEASGKTSNLSRADRAVLKEIDGKTVLANIAAKFEKIPADKFDALIAQFDKDGYIREVSSGSQPAAPTPARSAAPAKAPPPPSGGGDDEMDFTQAIKLPPKAPAPGAPRPPPVDLAAAARADTERKAKEQQAFDYKARQEAELKAQAEAGAKAKAEAEQRVRAVAEAKSRAESDARAKAESEADAKVKAAREAAIRMAAEVKAKAEAEGKAKTDAAEEREREALERARRESEDKARLEAELTGKLEQERRAREDAERRAREAADQARKEMGEKAKRDADELRQRLEAEMKAKLEEERKAREAEDRKRREEEERKRAEEDRKRREEDDRRRKEDEERRAKEAAERKAREEEDRKRREEEDRRRKAEEEQRAKEAAERRAREEADREADRKRREEGDRKRAEEDKRRKEDDARRAKEDADRRAREDAERRAKDEAERRAKADAERRASEDTERRARDEAERKAKQEAEEKARAAQAASARSASIPSIPPVAAAPPPPAAGGDIGDSLLADLDSFGKREEEEQKAKEETERQAKEEAARKAKAEAERKAKEEAERRAKEEAEKKRREEEERKAKEESEQRAKEEEEREKQEEAERKRKAKDALAAKEAERKAAQRAAAAKSAGKSDDDIGVTDDDLDMDDIKKDEKALSATARKAAREQAPVAAVAVRQPKKWGKPAAIALFVLMIGGVGVLQFMPVSTAEYEKAASEAMGVPVKIGSAHLSVITGIETRFESVSVGDAVKIRTVRGSPEIGSLFGGKKSFSRIELEGMSLSQSQLADAVLGKVSGENFRVGRVVIKQAKFDGPLTLPALDVEATVSGDGSLQSISLRGGDKLSVQLSPKGNDIGFEISAGSLALPFAPALNLSDFEMKGTANRGGVTASEFNGRAFDGVISGTAKIRWGASWLVDGDVRARGVRVAVIAPALISEGKVDGRGTYTLSGPNPATLFESARIQGEFKIDKGVLGSFDLTRALQTGGAQTGGRTIFTELTGQAVYDKGTVKVTNAAIAAGAMNAGASLDVDASGGLSGRIVADVKTPNQTLRATLNISGKIQEPVIRK